ncbi:pectate lyase family protein [Streptomyces odontomachi]|uniref:pectate lyase family protein n=1 Tax=Streptomyces odontomachi TaxID=2944940 RepID=UPI00210E2C53|nr:right-handed parallel beta-helix repeat-containing protein [Streptomyces sp. ODS25]
MRHSKLNAGRTRRIGLVVGAAGALVAGSMMVLAPAASAGSAMPADAGSAHRSGVAGSAQPLADGPVGFAAQNGGTTGGFGAGTVNEYVLSDYTASSGAGSPGDAMYQLLKDQQDHPDEGLVIYVDETISASDFSESKMDVKDVANVSILGVGDQGEFSGVGINIARAHNIVIRNLTIHNVAQGDKDGIGIQSESSNIWIDHNELYNEYQGVDKDYYDGLIDLKDQSKYITVSWNYLHDSWKAMLTASSDSADKAGDYITYMDNHFKNVNSRLPLIRYSHVHVLNNFYEDILGSAVNCRMGAQVLVEGNYFLRTGSGNPDDETGQIEGPVGWWYGSDETGYWHLVNNTFDDSPGADLTSTTDYTVPYSYTALSPEQAKSQTTTSAGAGVIDVTP